MSVGDSNEIWFSNVTALKMVALRLIIGQVMAVITIFYCLMEKRKDRKLWVQRILLLMRLVMSYRLHTHKMVNDSFI